MWRAKTPQNINRASPFYTGRLFISSVKPRAFKPTFQVNKIGLNVQDLASVTSSAVG